MAIKFYDIKQKYSKLIENFISLNILQIINYIIPLITFPYISRVLGANKFGLVYFALSLAQYFIVLTDFGFNASGVIEISKNREDNTKLS